MQLFLLILKLFLKIKRSQDLELLAIGSLSVHTCAWNLVPIWSKTHHWVIYLEFCLRLPCFDAHKSWPFKTGWRFPCQRAEQRCVRSGLAKLQACPFFAHDLRPIIKEWTFLCQRICFSLLQQQTMFLIVCNGSTKFN